MRRSPVIVRSCPSLRAGSAGTSGVGVCPTGGVAGNAALAGMRAPHFEQNSAVEGILAPQEGHNVSVGSAAGKRLAQLKQRV